ncbi:PIN domain-containing protein [Aliihoeflea sp. PC F10.4]
MGSIFLLDTNVVSQFSLPRPPPALRNWLLSDDVEGVVLPFGAMVELERGIAWIESSSPEKAGRLRDWLNGLLGTDIAWPEIDVETARLYARMTTCMPLRDLWQPQARRRRPGLGMDVLIAAQSIVTNAPVATLNDKHFKLIDQHFPMPGIYNPLTDVWTSSTIAMGLVGYGSLPSRQDVAMDEI